MDNILRVTGLTKRFGGITAVDNVTLNVKQGEILGLIGPNGAGKTTLLNLICKLLDPDSGQIYFKNENISNLQPHQIALKGIGRTFQITRVFRKMTTLENMLVPATHFRETLGKLREKACELLNFFEILHLKDEFAENLSGGQQKLLEIARVSMLNPFIFLMDEPFYGIHTVLKSKILEKIRVMSEIQNKTFIIISHDIPSIMGVCREIVVMSGGRLIANGPPKEIRENKEVIEAYLGV